MKIFKKTIQLFTLIGVISLFSCADYLDKAPTADILDETIFSNFRNYQGYVETMYGDVMNMVAGGSGTLAKNYGDDVSPRYSWYGFVSGNYKQIYGRREFEFWNAGAQRSRQGTTNDIWHNSWYGIRAANIGLEHLDDLVEATDDNNDLLQQQKNLIEGQCYYFRGYFHLQMIKAWGDIPYADYVFPSDVPEVAPLGLYVTMEKVVEDLDKAIALLPSDWDEIATGQLTLNQNIGRATKGMALAVKAECLLFAASPLFNGTVNGNYDYNIEYAKKGAEAAWQIIKLANDEGVYELEPWDTYSDIFYRRDNVIPKSKEHIVMATVRGTAAYEFQAFRPDASQTTSPTENYVRRFGMANGLPTFDPASGFDENNPWVNREPRFYYNIRLNGDRIAYSTNDEQKAFVWYYVNAPIQVGTTGYGYQKYMDGHVNWLDGGIGGYYYRIPKLRFSEMYLIYAELVNEAYGPNGKHPGADISAIDAVNILRTRAGVPDVHSKYTGSKELFRERIRDERAVELAFEAKRWYDIRRWYVAHLPEYTEKYKLEFDKEETYYKMVLLETTIFEERKHYWLPFNEAQVKLYPEWKQNPGWDE